MVFGNTILTLSLPMVLYSGEHYIQAMAGSHGTIGKFWEESGFLKIQLYNGLSVVQRHSVLIFFCFIV